MQKVRAGQIFEPSAQDWNSFIEATKIARDLAAKTRPTQRRYSEVLVKNTEAQLMTVGCPVKLGAFQAEQVPEIAAAVEGAGYFEATFPTAVLTLPECGVAATPIEAGKMGFVAVEGVFWARVAGTDVGQYIDTLPSSDPQHKSAWRYSDSGPHRVRARTANGAIVQLGCGAWEFFAVTPAGGIAAEGAAVCSIERVNPASGAITSTPYTVSVRNRSKFKIEESVRVQVSRVGDVLFTADPIARVYLLGGDGSIRYDTLQKQNVLVIESTTSCP